jgi:methylmalonyl-CoA mutase N-terminal domain/subunit
VSEDAERDQRARMKRMRERRDDALVKRQLDTLRETARANRNVMPALIDCARAYCTLYEIRAAMEDVYGAYREPVFF